MSGVSSDPIAHEFSKLAAMPNELETSGIRKQYLVRELLSRLQKESQAWPSKAPTMMM